MLRSRRALTPWSLRRKSACTIGLIVILGFGLVPARVEAQSAQRECLALVFGQWSPQSQLGGDTVFTTAPGLVELLTGEAPEAHEYHPVRAEQTSGKDWLPQKMWRQVAGDSIELVFSNGFSGVDVHLPKVGDSAQGTGATFWDFPRRPQSAVVQAHRVPCPDN